MENKEVNIPFRDWDEFYEACKPEGLIIQYRNVKTIKQSIDIKRISLGEMTTLYGKYKHKVYGECTVGILYLYEWLNYLNNISNINKPLLPKNIEQLSVILYTKYFFLYLSDLKLILEGILEGKYGKFYGSVDAQLIMSAFKEYSDSRRLIEYEMKNKR